MTTTTSRRRSAAKFTSAVSVSLKTLVILFGVAHATAASLPLGMRQHHSAPAPLFVLFTPGAAASLLGAAATAGAIPAVTPVAAATAAAATAASFPLPFRSS